MQAANGQARWWNVSTGGTLQTAVELVANDASGTSRPTSGQHINSNNNYNNNNNGYPTGNNQPNYPNNNNNHNGNNNNGSGYKEYSSGGRVTGPNASPAPATYGNPYQTSTNASALDPRPPYAVRFIFRV